MGRSYRGVWFLPENVPEEVVPKEIENGSGFFQVGSTHVFLFESAHFEGTESEGVPLSGNILLCRNTFYKQINQWNLNLNLHLNLKMIEI